MYAGRQDTGNWGNIQSALSEGRALRLVLNQPTLAVTLVLPSHNEDIAPDQMLIVTELGHTFTYPQYQAILARTQRWP